MYAPNIIFEQIIEYCVGYSEEVFNTAPALLGFFNDVIDAWEKEDTTTALGHLDYSINRSFVYYGYL